MPREVSVIVQIDEDRLRRLVAEAAAEWKANLVLTWHPVAEGICEPVEVPLNERVVWAPAANLGEFVLSTREAPASVDEHPWCPHPECHDRLHGDSVHTDERGRPFTGKPGDPYEWTDRPEVSGG